MRVLLCRVILPDVRPMRAAERGAKRGKIGVRRGSGVEEVRSLGYDLGPIIDLGCSEPGDDQSSHSGSD
jgi:hypothetical protein